MATKTLKIKIICDVSPLLLFVKLFVDALQRFGRTVKLGDFPAMPGRIEQYFDPANASKIFVRLYPSDAFLRFAATTLAREFDLSVVDDPGHNNKTSKKG